MVGSCDVKFPIRLEGLVLTHSQFSRWVFLNSAPLEVHIIFILLTATSLSYFLVLFIVWWNPVLCYWFSSPAKSCLRVSLNFIAKLFCFSFFLKILFSIWRCQSSTRDLRSLRQHLSYPEEFQEAIVNNFPSLIGTVSTAVSSQSPPANVIGRESRTHQKLRVDGS